MTTLTINSEGILISGEIREQLAFQHFGNLSIVASDNTRIMVDRNSNKFKHGLFKVINPGEKIRDNGGDVIVFDQGIEWVQIGARRINRA